MFDQTDVPPGPIHLGRKQAVGSATLPSAAGHPLVQPADGNLRSLGQHQPAVDIVSPAIPFVGKVRLPVVLEAVDECVVVHVHSEEELWRIHGVAQEGLGIVGSSVGILVEIGDKVVVLVESGEDVVVGTRPAHIPDQSDLIDALPVREAILIVVVIDELKQVPLLVAVVDAPQ